MKVDRRQMVGGATLLGLLGTAAGSVIGDTVPYGSLGRIRAKPGQRDALWPLIAGFDSSAELDVLSMTAGAN